MGLVAGRGAADGGGASGCLGTKWAEGRAITTQIVIMATKPMTIIMLMVVNVMVMKTNMMIMVSCN